jgi:hypothetical protein
VKVSRRERGSEELVLGQGDVQLGQRPDVLTSRPADHQVRRRLPRLGRHLADAVDVRLAEAEPEPRVHEGGIVRRHQRVVRVPAALDPGRRGRGVEVADRLGLAHGVPGRLDPEVRSPRRLVAVPAQQVAGHLAVLHGHGSGGAVREQRRDLVPRLRRVLVPLVEQRLDPAHGGVARRQQPAGGVEVVGGEGSDRRPGHGRAPYEEGRCRARTYPCNAATRRCRAPVGG